MILVPDGDIYTLYVWSLYNICWVSSYGRIAAKPTYWWGILCYCILSDTTNQIFTFNVFSLIRLKKFFFNFTFQVSVVRAIIIVKWSRKLKLSMYVINQHKLYLLSVCAYQYVQSVLSFRIRMCVMRPVCSVSWLDG